MQTMFNKILHFENEQFNIEALNQANNDYFAESDEKRKKIDNILSQYIHVYDECLKIGQNEYSNIVSTLNLLSDYEKDYYYNTYWLQSNFYNNIPCVYFIRNKYTKLIKIGKTKNIAKRISQIRSMFKNHFGVNDGLELIGILPVFNGEESKLETYLHKKYKYYNTYGEWFNIDFSVILNECFTSWCKCCGIITGRIESIIPNYGINCYACNPDLQDLQTYAYMKIFSQNETAFNFLAFSVYKIKNIIIPSRNYSYINNKSVDMMRFALWMRNNGYIDYLLENISDDDGYCDEYSVDSVVNLHCINCFKRDKYKNNIFVK